MQVRQCRMCNKLFQSMGNYICVECQERLDQEFRVVRDYLYENPAADITEISQKTGVSERSILQFLKEERLTLSAPCESIRCEHCGKPVAGGKICTDCKERLSRLLDSITEANAEKLAEKKASIMISYQGRRHFEENRR